MQCRTSLTDDEKTFLFHHGCVALRGIVDPQLIERVREATKELEEAPSIDWDAFAQKYGSQHIATSSVVLDVLNKSALAPILREVMGEFDPPHIAQYVPTARTTAQGLELFNTLGYKNKDTPYHGATLHIDAVMQHGSVIVQEGTEEEIYNRWIAAGPNGDIGRSAEVIGQNGVPLFMDPEMTLGVSSFTCFVCVACSDQEEKGVGQTMVVPGGHFAMERFFRWQAAQGPRLGPEGPGWPRLDHEAPNRCGQVTIPPRVLAELLAEDSREPARTADGRAWVIPTAVNMRKGDALIALHALPHSMSRNDNGTETRKQIIFRLRNKKQQPSLVHGGLSPCPDRLPSGGWIKHEPSNDPFAKSKHHLLHMWDNWDGMQEVVARERPTTILTYSQAKEEGRKKLSCIEQFERSAL